MHKTTSSRMTGQHHTAFSSPVIILQLIGFTHAYLPKCPQYHEKILRSSLYCKHNSSTIYSCLYDTENVFVQEFCKEDPDYSPPGQKYVWTGGLRNVKCSDDRFQPFALYENASSKCLYLKSDCNEEGQLIYDDDLLIKDRRCFCDHSKGYSFVNEPEQHCFCKPREEDCSCYKKSCKWDEVLRTDYRCVPIQERNNSTCLDKYNVSHQTNVTEEPIACIEVAERVRSKNYTEEVVVLVVFVIFVAVNGGLIFNLGKVHEKINDALGGCKNLKLFTAKMPVQCSGGNQVKLNCQCSDKDNIEEDTETHEQQVLVEEPVDCSNAQPLECSGKDNIEGENETHEKQVLAEDKCSSAKQVRKIGQCSDTDTTEGDNETDIKQDLVEEPVDCSNAQPLECSGKDNREGETESHDKQVLESEINYDNGKEAPTNLPVRYSTTADIHANEMNGSNESTGSEVEIKPYNRKDDSIFKEKRLYITIGKTKPVSPSSDKTQENDNRRHESDFNEKDLKEGQIMEISDEALYAILDPEKQNTLTGSKCTLELTVISKQEIVKIEWFFDNGLSDTYLNISDNPEKYQGGTVECESLVIKNLKLCDGGIYKCQVSDSTKTVTSNSVTIKVLEPKIETQLERKMEGNTRKYVIKCTILNIPDPTRLYFLCQDRTDSITYHEPDTKNHLESFTECTLQAKKSGKYTCVATKDCTTIRDEVHVRVPNEITENRNNVTDRTHDDESVVQESKKRSAILQQDTPLPESKTQLKDSKDGNEETRFRIVVSLDIGTMFSRYSFILTDTRQIDLSSAVSNCLPTCVLFSLPKESVPSSNVCLQSDDKYEFWDIVSSQKNDLGDSMESPERIKKECDFFSLGTPTKHGYQRFHLIFEKFKLELYRHKTITDELKVDDIHGRKMKALDVYSALIKALRSEVLSKMKETHNGFHVNDITWVVTVPEAWSDGGLNFINLACQRGGIDSKKLILESEFTAVLKYYQYSESIPVQIAENSTYLIAHLGGGTWDITVYKVHESKKIQKKPSFVSCCYEKVTDGIMDQLRKVIGDPAMKKLKKEYTDSYIILKEQFGNIDILSGNMITVPTHVMLVLDKLCKYFCLSSFEKTVEDFGWESKENDDSSFHIDDGLTELSTSDESNYQRNIKVVDDKLFIRKTFIESLLKCVSIEIVTEMKDALKKEKVDDVNAILLFGGYSSLSILKTEIQQAFKDKQILTLEDNVFCISKGALLCGIHKIK